MKIEILVPALGCLFGDAGNTLYLKKCFPEAEIIETSLNDTPAFLSENVDLCCMYSLSEQSQERVLARWLPKAEQIKEKMQAGNTFFLFTGNAWELLGQSIEKEDGTQIDALGLYPFTVKRQAPKRFNTLMKTEFQGMTLLGYTSRFSHTYEIPENVTMQTVTLGVGANPQTNREGIFDGKVLGTYMLGPLLVANPAFTKWLCEQLGKPLEALPFEAALQEAYNQKLKEFDKPELELE